MNTSLFTPSSLGGALMLCVGAGFEVSSSMRQKDDVPKTVVSAPEVVGTERKTEASPKAQAAEPEIGRKKEPEPPQPVPPVAKPEPVKPKEVPLVAKVEPAPKPTPTVTPTPPSPVPIPKALPVPPVKAVPIKAVKEPIYLPPPVPPQLFDPDSWAPIPENVMFWDSVKPTEEFIGSIQGRLAEVSESIVARGGTISELTSKLMDLQREYDDEVAGRNGKPGVGPKARAMEEELDPLRASIDRRKRELLIMEQERNGYVQLLGTMTSNLGVPVIGRICEEDILSLIGRTEVTRISPELANELNQSLASIPRAMIELPLEDVDNYRAQPKKTVTIAPGAKVPIAVVESIRSTASRKRTEELDELQVVEPNTAKMVGKIVKFPSPKAVNGYDEPFPRKSKKKSLSGGELFGGIRSKTHYRNVSGTVFSHMGKIKDKGDNGKSFWNFLTGARVGENGKIVHHNEGVALPPQIYELVGPASEVEIWIKNTDNGCIVVCPVVDVGPSNWVWKLMGGPVIDLTPKTAVALGATIYSKKGSLRGAGGLRHNLEVEVVRKGEMPKFISF